MPSISYVGCLFLLCACSPHKQESQQALDSAQASFTTNTGQTTMPTAQSSTTKSGTVADAGKWLYEKRVDNEGRTVSKASTRSPTRLELAFPYTGGSTATLTIRKRVGSDTHLYIQLSNGQFNRSFQGGQARVRFDGGSSRLYSFSAAENGSANIIFFDATQALIQKLKAAQTMLIDVEFAGQGYQQIEFKTAGLHWDY